MEDEETRKGIWYSLYPDEEMPEPYDGAVDDFMCKFDYNFIKCPVITFKLRVNLEERVVHREEHILEEHILGRSVPYDPDICHYSKVCFNGAWFNVISREFDFTNDARCIRVTQERFFILELQPNAEEEYKAYIETLLQQGWFEIKED